MIPIPAGTKTEHSVPEMPARAAAPDPDHIRGDRRLVDKHQPRRIKEPLLPNPAPTLSRYVGSTSLGCTETFL
jgi:hypothetical protein